MRECLKKELSYRTGRSSGPGGQHVNKTESRVEVRWNLPASGCLDATQKSLVSKRLHARLSREGWLVLGSEKHRSQHRNREEVTERFFRLLQASLVPLKQRKATSPSRSSIENRIGHKKIRGQLKRFRMKPPED
jgi:ribosome-associated protein